MTTIHSTAIIEDGAKIGNDVTIGPYCFVGAQVELKDGVQLVSHVWVGGDTVVGENTEIRPFAAIGGKNQDLKDKEKKGKLIIGKNNSIREYATMQPGTPGDKNVTVVGDNGLFMIGTHIAHDCVVGNNVLMSNNATLAGHVKVGDNVIIGGLSAVHQFSRIGAHAMVGGMCGITRDVIPYSLISFNCLEGVNIVGLKRRGFSLDVINNLRLAVSEIFKGEGTLAERIKHVGEIYKDCAPVQEIVEFMQTDYKRGFMQPSTKTSIAE